MGEVVNLTGVNDVLHIKGRYIVKGSILTCELSAKNVTHFGIDNCTISV